jgi:hypothetical protein
LGAILSGRELNDLAAGFPARESFGPDSDRLLLAFALEGADAALGGWLSSLPCPVVGLGEGPLAACCDAVLSRADALEPIVANVARAPLAAMVLVQQLRLGEGLPEAEALVAESLAYGVVQGGPEFQAWRAVQPSTLPGAPLASPALLAEREPGTLRLTMNRPEDLNAIGVEMRDALVEAFELAAIDPEIERVTLAGAGRCFSTGGDVREFGLARDPGTAHWIRTLRLPARRLPSLRDRFQVRVHGAVIGAGLEIAAFAGRLEARRDAWFQLPELRYGLIPGAGGTVSIPRRIGRQRTAYLALSMRRLPAATALAWGLVDALAD